MKTIKSINEFEKIYFPKSYKQIQEERRIEEARNMGGEEAEAKEIGIIMAEKVLKKLKIMEVKMSKNFCFYHNDFDGKCAGAIVYNFLEKDEVDASKIAEKYNGGGHKKACGFSCKKLPFKRKDK